MQPFVARPGPGAPGQPQPSVQPQLQQPQARPFPAPGGGAAAVPTPTPFPSRPVSGGPVGAGPVPLFSGQPSSLAGNTPRPVLGPAFAAPLPHAQAQQPPPPVPMPAFTARLGAPVPPTLPPGWGGAPPFAGAPRPPLSAGQAVQMGSAGGFPPTFGVPGAPGALPPGVRNGLR